MSKGFASNYRAVVLAGFIFTAFAGLGARLVWLQAIGRGPLLAYVEGVRREIIVQKGRRGDIVDARGNILATSCSLFELGADPQEIRPADATRWPRLAALVGMPLPQLETILNTRFRSAAPAAETTADWGSASVAKAGWAAHGMTASPGESRPSPAAADLVFNSDSLDADGRRPIRWAKICDDVSEATYAEIQKLGIHGIVGNRIYRRTYPNNELAAHVIGYVNHEEQPAAGMEHYADFYLRGQNGWIESEKDGRREELAQFRTREVPAVDGYTVELSIDANIQHIAEAEIDAIVKRYQPQKVTVIVSDPRTGFILALANYPTFNLNTYNELPNDQQGDLRNIAVADQYEPGSVFKIVAVSGALNDGLITPETEFNCSLKQAADGKGVLRDLPGEDISDLKYFTHPITVAEVIQHSSNKGTVQVAFKLGEERFYSYVRAFGFGQPTGFPCGGEQVGEFKAPDKWDRLTFTRMPIGQSIAVTPLQMHQAMGVIASGGLLLRPRILTLVRDPQGDAVFQFGGNEVRRVISEDTARTMARLLMGVASPNGTAPEAAIPGYEVAGKTATAQKLEPEVTGSGRTVLRYSTTDHVASFIGFFPASRPQVEISVIIDDPDEHKLGAVAYGGKVAAPCFNHIGRQLISYLHIPKPGLPAPVIAMGEMGP
jgi:cell division protein FtsI/penicillin-binding protein 2